MSLTCLKVCWSVPEGERCENCPCTLPQAKVSLSDKNSRLVSTLRAEAEKMLAPEVNALVRVKLMDAAVAMSEGAERIEQLERDLADSKADCLRLHREKMEAKYGPENGGALSADAQPRAIEAEAGKYPANGDALLAILRGIKDDENRGVDKDRRRGATHAVDRCFWAVESWLRTGARSATTQPTLPDAERVTILNLIDVARSAHWALDDSEDRGEEIIIERAHSVLLSDLLNRLDDLPDDKPGYTMGPAQKAAWALRRLIGDDESVVDGKAAT